MPPQGRYCSLPDIGNIRKWFEKNFYNCCEYHDGLYTPPVVVSRLLADIMLCEYMKEAIINAGKSTRSRWLVYYPIIALTFVGVRIFGWTRYNKGK